MSLVKIANCCQPNSIITLKEYLKDYASPATRAKVEQIITAEMKRMPNEKIREFVCSNLEKIANEESDFRL